MRPSDLDAATGGRADLSQHLEQGGFAGAVVADDADHFALLDGEPHVVQRLEQWTLWHLSSPPGGAPVLSRVCLRLCIAPQAVLLGEMVDLNYGHFLTCNDTKKRRVTGILPGDACN